jgi:hypothetical protein
MEEILALKARNNTNCPYGHVPFITKQNKRLFVGLPELLARTLLGDVAGAPALVAELCTGRGAILHDMANLENQINISYYVFISAGDP